MGELLGVSGGVQSEEERFVGAGGGEEKGVEDGRSMWMSKSKSRQSQGVEHGWSSSGFVVSIGISSSWRAVGGGVGRSAERAMDEANTLRALAGAGADGVDGDKDGQLAVDDAEENYRRSPLALFKARDAYLTSHAPPAATPPLL